MKTILNLVIFALLFFPWPVAVYISTRKVNGSSSGKALFHAIIAGFVLFFGVIAAIDILIPMARGSVILTIVYLTGYCLFPFLLVVLESLFRKWRSKQKSAT